jgi:GntP family gluconate:H+ symporter
MSWIAANLAPIMFGSILLFLLTGFPVAFALASVGIVFGWVAIELGLIPAVFFNAMPMRIFGIMSNDVLLAIPFFTFMGLILERSRMAEDLLETIGQVFGPLRGGLAIAVVFVGTLLAATTGVVAASVIAMGLISLPIMLRYGYNRPLTTGVITASGTLAQIVPPSIVLIIIADQLGQSVGQMYRAAFIPAFTLVGLYVLLVVVITIVRPKWVPALPPEALIYNESNGNTGHKSLGVLAVLSGLVGYMVFANWGVIKLWLGGDPMFPPLLDERIVIGIMGAIGSAWLFAVIDRMLRLNLFSKLARQVTFVLIPPLMLIFLVLGTIFLGMATPTEAGAFGALGAVIMAWGRGRLTLPLMRQGLDSSARLSIFVMFILIGSTIFGLTFQAIDGPIWVKSLFAMLPGGELGFMLFVNTMIFILGFFIDFFEIAFILLPLLLPVLIKMDVNLIWFGVMVALNMQTSFLTPPFGFALFYLRSVAPKADYIDRVTKRRIAKITTADIYRGAVIFVILQVILVLAVLFNPGIVLKGLGQEKELDLENVEMYVPEIEEDEEWKPVF